MQNRARENESKIAGQSPDNARGSRHNFMNESIPPADPSDASPRARATRLPLNFSARQRLKGKTRIDSAYKTGQRRHHHPIMACLVRRADNDPSRVAVSMGRKCGNAVQRNAIRRRIREGYRLAQHDFPAGLDILLVIRPHKLMTVLEYQQRLRTLLL